MTAFLFVQTAFNYHDVALIVDGKIQKHWHIDEQRQTLKFLSGILPELHDLVFDHIVFVQGPGSFTALRVGATWVNTLAYTRNVLIKNISTLDYLELAAPEEPIITFDEKHYFLRSGSEIIVITEKPKNKFIHYAEDHFISFGYPEDYLPQKLTDYIYPEPVMTTDVLYVIPPKITLPTK
ncbi:MAG: hypothetical protein A2V81_05315 [Candidatus Abawacabacteria bacterium RBG_16_42_10]|uniref:Gcp-like domain-containing protein n=1 Tax=Candidatus Abawacabacteria bacterium RBG_16_42_10 TaxID=1817814 RepID=A0A1F4XJ44_9BACT|nr:MAG: hypothetical protein A2V81_05315 [Candidatus Abawacabacteria bacterium RBG_16_42_10]